MSKANKHLIVEGFDELIAKLNTFEGETVKAVNEGLTASAQMVTNDASLGIGVHNDTGLTAKSLNLHPKVIWVGGTQASIDVGFDLTKPHGYVSIFLMYGTPRMKKDQFLYNAFYSKQSRDSIIKTQREALENAIKKVGL